MQLLSNLSLLVGRILMVGIFVWDAIFILRQPEGTASFMVAFGLPGGLWPLVAAFQLIGGALIVLGWQARLGALAFAAFCAATAFVFHGNFGDTNQTLHFGKDLALAGGFLILAAVGPGGWSMAGAQE